MSFPSSPTIFDLAGHGIKVWFWNSVRDSKILKSLMERISGVKVVEKNFDEALRATLDFATHFLREKKALSDRSVNILDKTVKLLMADQAEITNGIESAGLNVFGDLFMTSPDVQTAIEAGAKSIAAKTGVMRKALEQEVKNPGDPDQFRKILSTYNFYHPRGLKAFENRVLKHEGWSHAERHVISKIFDILQEEVIADKYIQIPETDKQIKEEDADAWRARMNVLNEVLTKENPDIQTHLDAALPPHLRTAVKALPMVVKAAKAVPSAVNMIKKGANAVESALPHLGVNPIVNASLPLSMHAVESIDAINEAAGAKLGEVAVKVVRTIQESAGEKLGEVAAKVVRTLQESAGPGLLGNPVANAAALVEQATKAREQIEPHAMGPLQQLVLPSELPGLRFATEGQAGMDIPRGDKQESGNPAQHITVDSAQYSPLGKRSEIILEQSRLTGTAHAINVHNHAHAESQQLEERMVKTCESALSQARQNWRPVDFVGEDLLSAAFLEQQEKMHISFPKTASEAQSYYDSAWNMGKAGWNYGMSWLGYQGSPAQQQLRQRVQALDHACHGNKELMQEASHYLDRTFAEACLLEPLNGLRVEGEEILLRFPTSSKECLLRMHPGGPRYRYTVERKGDDATALTIEASWEIQEYGELAATLKPQSTSSSSLHTSVQLILREADKGAGIVTSIHPLGLSASIDNRIVFSTRESA